MKLNNLIKMIGFYSNASPSPKGMRMLLFNTMPSAACFYALR